MQGTRKSEHPGPRGMNEPMLASFALASGGANRQSPRDLGATGAESQKEMKP